MFTGVLSSGFSSNSPWASLSIAMTSVQTSIFQPCAGPQYIGFPIGTSNAICPILDPPLFPRNVLLCLINSPVVGTTIYPVVKPNILTSLFFITPPINETSNLLLLSANPLSNISFSPLNPLHTSLNLYQCNGLPGLWTYSIYAPPYSQGKTSKTQNHRITSLIKIWQ